MTDNIIDVFLCQTVAFQQSRTVVAHGRDSITEHCAPLLVSVMQPMVDREPGRGAYGTARLDVEERKSLAVRTVVGVYQTDVFLGRPFNHHGTCPVTEERTGRTVTVVGNGRHLVSSDYDDALVTAALDHVAGNIESIHEAAARSSKVKCESVLQPQLAQDNGSCRRVRIVRSRSGDDDSIDTVRIGTGLLHQKFGRLACHIGCAETFLRENAALLDARAGGNPLVIGIHHTRQFLVVEDIVGHVTCDTCDDRIDVAHVYSAVSFTTATFPR